MTRLKVFAAAFVMAVLPVFGAVPAMAADQASPASTVGYRGDLVFGSKDAPVEVIEYGALTCPHCGHFANDIFPTIKKDYIDTGKVRFTFRHFLINRIDLAAAQAARCTDSPEKVKEMVANLYAHQKEWVLADNQYEAIAGLVAKSGVTKKDFATCLTNDGLAKYLIEMTQDGVKKYHITGVPAIIVNGTLLEKHDLDSVKKALDSAQ